MGKHGAKLVVMSAVERQPEPFVRCRGLKKQRSEQGRAAWRHDASSRQVAAQAIAAVLKEMWNQQHEIPVIACYRKQVRVSHQRTSWPTEASSGLCPAQTALCSCAASCWGFGPRIGRDSRPTGRPGAGARPASRTSRRAPSR